ncbi:hypothetical protein JCM11491_000704 [Sporobolomyces phaffii]
MKDSSLWLVTSPADSDPHERLEDLRSALGNGKKLATCSLVELPAFKTGTLSSLLTLSDQLAKHDPAVTQALAKTVDTIRSLTSPSDSPSSSDRASPLASHLVLDDGRPYFDYFDPAGAWTWDKAKVRTDDRALADVVESLLAEVASIENSQRTQQQEYTAVKSQLVQHVRKQQGNLSIRSLAGVVSADDFAATRDSEYLETILVAVPRTLEKDWNTEYERLASMVVPRSSVKLATDDEYALFSVTVFRRVKDEFSQKAREKK